MDAAKGKDEQPVLESYRIYEGKPLRRGFTTGMAAAGAAKAAALVLFGHDPFDQVKVVTPLGIELYLSLSQWEVGPDWVRCCVIKDGGDDPDVTHGTPICALVRRLPEEGVRLRGGKGVGQVTKPGLAVPVGEPAINPVPRQQILANVTDAVREVSLNAEERLATTSLSVEIIVPDGERLAQKTLNPRLGIVGGISILGTSGKVYPYSTAAWRASVVQAVELAAHHNISQLVLTTGSRSERFAMQIYPGLPKLAFVEMGVFTGAALETCVARGVQSISIVAMVGKLIKTAQGYMNTHASKTNRVEVEFLAQVCRDVNAPGDLVAAVLGANTGRHFLELCTKYNDLRPVQRVINVALAQVVKFVTGKGGSCKCLSILVFSPVPVANGNRPQTLQICCGTYTDHTSCEPSL
ncbi:MAG: cobalt-precorrin-5B (C(1))-methyltransferase, partial [Firmicutes bacterium]|nr:cobalt-precorrin-5B (C(1))-methyltransferase [Bacillota bacterium]